jgi:deoxyribose-phosphate aldolase
MNKLIDHTILKPYATSVDIEKICAEAKQYRFKTVCVNPVYVKKAKELLKGSDVLVCTVVGFPLGANTIEVKEAETKDAIQNGADEIDMVINIGKAKEHDYEYLYQEMCRIRAAAQGKTLKVILETCYLTDEEKVAVCREATKAKVDFVKTSTGFGNGGATVADVELMKKSVGNGVSVKASGGIRNRTDLEAMVKAGATRIGSSAGKELL